MTSTAPDSAAKSSAHDGRTPTCATLDAREVAEFARLASEWWSPKGKFRLLHRIGPARMEFIKGEIVARFGRDPQAPKPFADLRVLDIGCGGGIVAEPMARLGAIVTGIDPGAETVAAARAHAEASHLPIDYRAARVEDLAENNETFDVVLCLEVVEHVPDVAAFLTECAKLVRPGGLLVLSTLNRTLRSYVLAIAAAEYVLRWIPPGTHQWARFVTPLELERYLATAGLKLSCVTGLVYDPLKDIWRLDADARVNYLAAATRPA